MKNILVKTVIIVFIFLSIACSGSSSTLEQGNGDSDASLGTIIGNPTGTGGKSSLVVNNLLLDNDMATQIACTLLTKENSTALQTQRCSFTPSRYAFHTSQIFLLSCTDPSGAPTVCGTANYRVATRIPVYSDDAINVAVDSTTSSVDLDLSNVTETFQFGGVQIVTPYLEGTLPSNSDLDGNRITAELQGKVFRICTASDPSSTSEVCGISGALRGDLLFDYDGDGTLGFVNPAGHELNQVPETSTRPENYQPFMVNSIAAGTFAFTGVPSEEYTDGTSFGSSEQIFAPILRAKNVTEINPNQNYTFSVQIDISNSYFFIDGLFNQTLDDVCVEVLTGEKCTTNFDPLSAGFYDPYYDGAIGPVGPTVDVEVTHVVE